MPDYRLYQKEHAVRAVNVGRQDQQEALVAEGYKIVWDVVHANNAEAALLRYQQLRHEADTAAQTFATDSVVGSLLNLISR